jgi:hypothetical protein
VATPLKIEINSCGLWSISLRDNGKKLLRLFNNGGNNEQFVRPIINVYNKKISEKNTATSGIGLNRGGGFVVENHSQNISSFIESTNIGVSIVELSPEDII